LWLVFGLIGSILGSWIDRKAGLPEPLMVQFAAGAQFPFFWSIIGAALFVAVVVLISGRRA